MKNKHLYLSLGILLGAFLIAGCATDLKPAPSAKVAPGLNDAAVSTVEGVHVVAQASEWPGEAPIEQEVTPIRVRIENNSGRALRVRYSEFALVSPDYELYSALPLSRIEGQVSEYVATSMGPPGFAYEDFYVAPRLSRTYPMIPPYTGAFGHDSVYDDYYSNYWRSISLPTAAMWRNALPEGVINNGGSLDGWLFFEKVNANSDRLTFRTDLVNAENGQKFGEIRIPFVVE